MFNKNQIENLRKKLKISDPGIFEKTVRAFSLLDGLLKVCPGLIFKGGTSILLHCFPPERLSIDIDIILPEKDREILSANINAVAETSGFKTVREDKRQSAIPKAHYKFRYDPFFGTREDSILLDVVFCDHPYYRIIEKPLKGHRLISPDNMHGIVKVPTVDGLIGDKMTAVSPKTLGLRLTEGRDMEYLKQIIDLGILFGMIEDLKDVRETFSKTCVIENDFRKSKHPEGEILDDIVEVAFRYSQWLLKGADNSFKEINSINKGFERLTNHLVTRISHDDLKVSFAKVVYIGRLILDPGVSKVVKNVDLSVIDGIQLEGKYKILAGLKKRSVLAYFYWALAVGTKS